VTIDGSLNSRASRTFRVEFFTSEVCDASGYGEAERYLGFTDVTLDGSGNGTFSVVLPPLVSDGDSIATSATDSGGNTSELCGCFTAACLPLAAFPHTVLAQDANTMGWGASQDVRYVKGDLTGLSTYTTTGDGTMLGATTLDTSMDSPGPGSGLYYLVRPLGCGSWETVLGMEPGRDPALP
jgi:hypothetical protein